MSKFNSTTLTENQINTCRMIIIIIIIIIIGLFDNQNIFMLSNFTFRCNIIFKVILELAIITIILAQN